MRKKFLTPLYINFHNKNKVHGNFNEDFDLSEASAI